MKSNLYIFLFFIIFLNIQKVKSQDQDNPQKPYLPNITVSAPQAASLGKVGEIPIDISTGRMNYSIPIFEIREGAFSMPINLSYNYSGLVLDEVPGYAGVGWTFNIGGSILHSINGLNDEGHENDKQYIHNYINKLPPYNDQSTPAGQTNINNFLEYIANGIFDGEPDKYSVNIGNINCSFYLDKDNNPVFLKNENYKLSGNSTLGFTLTDDQGINYVFNLRQTADKVTENEQYSYNSSFLITEINFPFTTNIITFEYSDAIQYNDINFSQSLIKSTNQYGNPNNNFVLRNNNTTTILNTVRLNKIVTNNYTIELQYSNNPTEQGITVISNLSVKDKFAKSVKNYDFTYSGWTGRRTNLLNVKFNGIVTNEMEYDMEKPYPVVLDNRDRAQKDLWGYYNRKGELVSANGITGSYNNPKFRPDFESTKIGALTKITYQTKGYSVIEYEPNVVYMKSSDYNFPYDSDGLTTLPIGSVSTDPATGGTNRVTFSISNVPAQLVPRYQFTNGFEMAGEHDRNGFINLYENGKIKLTAKQYWGRELGTWTPPQRSFVNSNPDNIINVDTPGTYILEAISDQGITAELSVIAKQTPEYFNQVVGGIRVKLIKNCDFNGECTTTVYNYTQDGKSTGLMLQKPEFYSGYSIYDNISCSQGNYVRQDYYNFTSIYPLSNYRGSPVLYKKVEKTDFGRNGNNQLVSNGKTIFSYYGDKVTNSLKDEESYFTIGLLDGKLVKDDGGGKVAKQKNSYLNGAQPGAPKFVYAVQSKIILERRAQLSGAGGSSGGGCGLSYPRPMNNFKLDQFRHEAKNYVLQKEESTNYFQGDSLVQSTSYDYNLNTGFLKSQTTKNSKKETLETKYFYATDLEMASEPFRDELITKNRIKSPLVVQNYNGEKLSEQKTEYAKNTSTSNFLLPKYVYANKGTGSIDKIVDKKITYDQYDDRGNILQYTPEKDYPVTIIWGYNKTQPIAKIEKLTYGQIAPYTANLLTSSNVDDDNCMSSGCNEQILRNKLNNLRNVFSQSMITTYTYNPLVGVTSITDAKGIPSYYEYDIFGRLKFIKDQDLNVLQKYCYNYKGQQVDCSDNSSTSVFIYKSVARSGSFTKNNCAVGGTGASVTYSQSAGAYISNTSQVDADTNGLAKFNTDGQAYANTNATCTFWNTTQSRLITRNNCAAGGTPGSVTYTVPAGRYNDVSQVGADGQAQSEINNNGQAYANGNATCTFWNTAQSRLITRNNCAAGGTPGSVTYTVPAGRYSDVSQVGADGQAQSEINNNGEAYANANATCTFWNTTQSRLITRNNCAAGGTPGSVTYTVPSGRYSDISQAGADGQAQSEINNNGQAYANANATCTFWNVAKTVVFERNNCAAGGTPGSVTYTVPAGRYSDVSQTGADSQAQTEVNNNGQAYANATATCTFYSIALSHDISKNDCALGGVGSSVVYSQAAGIEKSNVSQEDANSKGYIRWFTDGQAYINANGFCTFSSAALGGYFPKTNCGVGGDSPSIYYGQVAGAITSRKSQADADAQALAKFYADGEANANASQSCTYKNTVQSRLITRNNCAAGGTPESVWYTVAAGVHTSYISQADANIYAQLEIDTYGQTYANSTGSCVFYNKLIFPKYYKTDCPAGTTNPYVYYTVEAGKYHSTKSQLEADTMALIEANTYGPAYANEVGRCLNPGETEE